MRAPTVLPSEQCDVACIYEYIWRTVGHKNSYVCFCFRKFISYRQSNHIPVVVTHDYIRVVVLSSPCHVLGHSLYCNASRILTSLSKPCVYEFL